MAKPTRRQVVAAQPGRHWRTHAAEVDIDVVAETPRGFRAVGEWYRHFAQTTDEPVGELLQRARDRKRTISHAGS